MVLCSRIGPYRLYTFDLERLAPNRELESEVINAYLTLLTISHNSVATTKAAVLDTFQLMSIWSRTAQRMRKLDPMDFDILIGALNKGNHWIFVAMYPKEGRVLYLNSLGETSSELKMCQQRTRLFMELQGHQLPQWRCQTLPHPQQMDGTSCGVFVCKFAEFVLRGEPITFSSEGPAINRFRREIALMLLRKD
ncbi:sentrin-specific protease 2-like [Centroberyx affinis]|uniref:sentrin-specific protease 2-like n=1 Tax=Centroberyx affinis TaxID=166261 RepID=UPI003A5C01B5